MSIDRLRELKTMCRLQGSGIALWAVGWIDQYEREASNGLTTDRAIGLIPGRGQTPWYEQERVRQRNAVLVELGKAIPGSPQDKSKMILRKLGAYAQARYRIDFVKSKPRGTGRERELMFQATQLGAVELSAGMICKILKNNVNELPDLIPETRDSV